jgi:pilus assembly protein CpaE
VDDYLTKPVHPAELIAHVKSLLSRGKARAPAVEIGYMIGVIAPKGGLGVSSFVLNLAIAIHQSTKIEVIAAELRPGSGSWVFDLGFNDVDALSKLLKNHAKDITASSVEKELIQSKYGIRLLPSSTNIMDVELTRATEQMEAIAGFLPQLAPLVLLDIGANMLPNVDRVLKMCKEIIVITEPYPGTINLTKRLLEQLSGIGIGKTNIISAIVVNRTRADMQLTVPQIQEILGMPIIHLIPPAPELAYQASMNNVPLSQFQPGGLIAQQFTRLAEIIIQHVKT